MHDDDDDDGGGERNSVASNSNKQTTTTGKGRKMELKRSELEARGAAGSIKFVHSPATAACLLLVSDGCSVDKSNRLRESELV